MRRVLTLAWMLGAALPGAAQDLSDRHLAVVPLDEGQTARRAGVLTPVSAFDAPESYERNAGGAATVARDGSAEVFTHASGNLAAEQRDAFLEGRAIFRKLWVAAPASTKGSDGLGPYYNARSCRDCHVQDGRGHLPGPGERMVSALVRISVPGGVAPAEIEGYLADLPDPTYGRQVQGFAAPGLSAEAQVEFSYETHEVVLADGLRVTLSKPVLALKAPGQGPFAAGLMTSVRLAPPMIGLGLLEAVPVADILTRADPDDADGDGISGRPNIVHSASLGGVMLGRFGWKAGQATLRDQVASALSGDMGLSNAVLPDPWGDCTAAQTGCRAAPVGQEPGLRDGLEIDRPSLDVLTFYSANLGVPARGDPGAAAVLRGKAVFHASGCAACHTPKQVTARLEGDSAQSFQLIWPYSDLLLHDMGEGLADNRPEARATGREWRTAPLWGLGLTRQVSPLSQYLHDGRARTPLEAILWHGGEAEAARAAVVALPTEDRQALLEFLESL